MSAQSEFFEQQIGSVQKALFVSAYAVLHNRDDAMEAVQQAVYTAYLKFHTCKDPNKFKAWITRITLNEAYKIWNRRKRSVPFDENTEPGLYDDASDLEFFDSISRLNKAEQEILVLRYFYDFPLSEISRVKKLPLSTVKSRLYRALDKLKTQWEGVEE